MIKICKATPEQYNHYINAETKQAKTARFNKILKSNQIDNIYRILDKITSLKKCGFCRRTAAVKSYDVIYDGKYIFIDNIVYLNDLKFCSIRPDSNKETCRGKLLNNNSKEFVKIAYEFETIEEANEYILMRNKSPFYKYSHSSKEEYSLYQKRDKDWFMSNNKDWEAYRERQRYTNNIEYFIELYGEVEGTVKYHNVNSLKDSSSLNANIERYGEEEGIVKFLEKCKKSDSKSIKYYIRKYGEEEGLKKYSYLRTLESYIERHGEVKGTVLYNKKYSSFETMQASKESMNNLFNFICKYMDENHTNLVYYVGAFGKKEYTIMKNGKRYFYDFAIPDLKIIVEYHGSRYHYNENFNYENCSPHIPLDKMKLKDDLKRKFTTDLGYEYIEVFDTDNFEEKINIVCNIIKERI